MTNRLRELSEEVRSLETKLREAGGAKKLEKLHEQGKLSARERVELLRDEGSSMLEIGLLVAYDQYDGQAPAAGVVTAVIRVHGRETVVVANDATVKAGSWWPETIKKILRAQEIAMRAFDYLSGRFGRRESPYSAAYSRAVRRVDLYYNSHAPYLNPANRGVMGPVLAGGAYFRRSPRDPCERNSFMDWRPESSKGAPAGG